MAFQFEQTDKTVQTGVRRIATEEVESALAALDDASRPLAERIHTARKAVKKLRGLIRLVRPVFAKYDTENTALREAGRRLSGLREAEVARATLASLAEDADLSEAETEDVAEPVQDRHATEHEALARAVEEFRATMVALQKRAETWRIRGKEFDALEKGLAGTWKDAGKAMKRALKSGRDKDFHEWRKRAKDHWYQARLLEPIWPEVMAPHVAAADRLGEALGEYNDLSVLIRDLAKGDGGDPARAKLVDEAGKRREALLDEASLLGRRLFAGPADTLTERWRVWWEVWRA
jgi:CHAD domain-containing protein